MACARCLLCCLRETPPIHLHCHSLPYVHSHICSRELDICSICRKWGYFSISWHDHRHDYSFCDRRSFLSFRLHKVSLVSEFYRLDSASISYSIKRLSRTGIFFTGIICDLSSDYETPEQNTKTLVIMRDFWRLRLFERR
jgi:hypothetical protein